MTANARLTRSGSDFSAFRQAQNSELGIQREQIRDKNGSNPSMTAIRHQRIVEEALKALAKARTDSSEPQ